MTHRVRTHPLLTPPFLRACRRQPVPHTPVWFMRQAGRSLPEYRKVREGIAMLESCTRPELVAEITLQPVRRYGVDAAIFFSDIVRAAQGGRRRPRHHARASARSSPSRSAPAPTSTRIARAHARATSPTSPRPCGLLTGELGATPLIGFAGAPFTLASYLVEGGPSQEPRAHQGADVRRPGRSGTR